jgi:hypothetical protein
VADDCDSDSDSGYIADNGDVNERVKVHLLASTWKCQKRHSFSIYVKWHILETWIRKTMDVVPFLCFTNICHNIPLLGCPWLLQVSPRPQSATFLPLCFWPSGWWLVGFPWWLWACAGTEELCPVVGYTLYHPHRLQRGSQL